VSTTPSTLSSKYDSVLLAEAKIQYNVIMKLDNHKMIARVIKRLHTFDYRCFYSKKLSTSRSFCAHSPENRTQLNRA